MSLRYESLLNQEEALEAARLQDAAVLKLWEAMGRLDFEQAVEHLAEVRSVAGSYSSEPARMSSEIIYMQCACALGETYIEAEECQLGYEVLIAVWEELLCFQSRMRSLGMPSKGTKVTLSLVADMAILKWYYPEYRALWPSLQELHLHFYEAVSRIVEYKRNLQTSDVQAGISNEALHLAHSAGARLAMHDYIYSREELDKLIQYLGAELGLGLSAKCFYFREIDPAQQHSNTFWDFEIAKMVAEGVGDLADYDFCCEQRRRILSSVIGTSDAVERLWAKERQHFMRGLALAPVSAGGADLAVTTSGRDKLNA